MNKTVVSTEAELQAMMRSCIREELQHLIGQLTPPPDNPEYLTRKEVSKLLSVSLVTLNSWEKKKVLVPHRIGTRVLYLASEVEQTLKQS